MRKQVHYSLLILFVMLIGGSIAIDVYVRSLGPRSKQRIIDALKERFDADVDLQSLSLSIFPQPNFAGEGLIIKHRGWSDAHPLLFIRRFDARTDILTLLSRRNNINFLRLEGLEIHVPARGRSATLTQVKDGGEVTSALPGRDTTHLSFLIQRILADGALLEVEPQMEGKEPLRFEIAKLALQSVGPGSPMVFRTTLTNAKPPGLINSTGTFGPWQKDDPRSTPLSGIYSFQNADLGVFNGISGILSSNGRYGGVLQHIEVSGVTDTPQFALQSGRPTVDLKTNFRAVVNGMDGDTILDPVDARFLNSEFICRGGVVGDGGDSKAVSLRAATTHARIEDILRLLGRGSPSLTGDMNFSSNIVIPSGHEQVLSKLHLDGQFLVSSARFTKSKIQQRLNTLSKRARGITKQESPLDSETVASNFRGRFKLDKGVASFASLSFDVPGAQVNLAGTYNLSSEQIDMNGNFRMAATLSETQSGIKHWLLKPFDRIFRRDEAGFQLPIFISGTKDDPEFGFTIFHYLDSPR